ncbi:UbiA family prenyltransferase [Micromonospora sp. NBS 11-29]|uniref:UbiA family prenyltransferase n=1 Tax=Micromonospora sp. NBS 11-29 TaxID=1960879 RepID=UPI000B78CCDA|nr:UbiA family prenyltransferase [Micromonospora sp. NBS 11-29]
MSTAGALRAHVETWRPYTLWYVGLVGLAGAAVVDGPHHPWLLLAAWAAPTAGWLGGHYLGDWFDRELDAGSKPHRPIPSRRLRAETAWRCGCACFAVLAVLAVLGGWGTTTAALLAAGGIVAYSRWLKARGIAGNLVRGALGAVALLYGALAVGLPPGRSTAVPVLLALTVAFWSHDAMSNLVGTLRDIDGDRAGGYETLPVRRGVPFAVRTVVVLYAVTIGAALVAGLLADRGARLTYLATLLVVLVLGVAALAPLVAQRAGMPVVVALRAHSVLVVERVVLASAVVGLGLGVGVQLALALPMVALTWWAQRGMRAGHELGPATAGLALATPRPVPLEDAP